jgi:hypothetical protein
VWLLVASSTIGFDNTRLPFQAPPSRMASAKRNTSAPVETNPPAGISVPNSGFRIIWPRPTSADASNMPGLSSDTRGITARVANAAVAPSAVSAMPKSSSSS